MKTRELIFCVASAMLVLPSSDAKEEKKSDIPVILHLEQRDYRVTVKSNGTHSRYTILDKRGQTVVADVGAAELKESHPEVYEAVKGALASQLGILDASLDPRYASPVSTLKDVF